MSCTGKKQRFLGKGKPMRRTLEIEILVKFIFFNK